MIPEGRRAVSLFWLLNACMQFYIQMTTEMAPKKSGRLQGACCFLPFEIVLLLVEDKEEGEVEAVFRG